MIPTSLQLFEVGCACGALAAALALLARIFRLLRPRLARCLRRWARHLDPSLYADGQPLEFIPSDVLCDTIVQRHVVAIVLYGSVKDCAEKGCPFRPHKTLDLQGGASIPEPAIIPALAQSVADRCVRAIMAKQQKKA